MDLYIHLYLLYFFISLLLNNIDLPFFCNKHIQHLTVFNLFYNKINYNNLLLQRKVYGILMLLIYV